MGNINDRETADNKMQTYDRDTILLRDKNIIFFFFELEKICRKQLEEYFLLYLDQLNTQNRINAALINKISNLNKNVNNICTDECAIL